MNTVYVSERARVICADARDVLRDMETESVDLVVVDPPYGVEWRSNMRQERFDVLIGDGADERDGVREILSECVRLVGQSRHLYVFGPEDVLEGLKVSETAKLIWDKVTNGLGNHENPWSASHEPITFAVSKHRHGGQTGETAIPARMRRGSVLRFQRATGRQVRHPTEKPWLLMAELIESSSRAGDLVLDPCAGTGATGVAAILRGRRCLLVEQNEEYAQLAGERIARAEEIAERMDVA